MRSYGRRSAPTRLEHPREQLRLLYEAARPLLMVGRLPAHLGEVPMGGKLFRRDVEAVCTAVDPLAE